MTVPTPKAVGEVLQKLQEMETLDKEFAKLNTDIQGILWGHTISPEIVSKRNLNGLLMAMLALLTSCSSDM
ncbi:hypothetical protein Q9L58_007447 [Maublancomyces gigas]|uniref:Uncharacterized protein n=1 Tax=Discina gigas TaxID=1032678 RepID=A0ABR3GCS9_9PEZI